MAEGQELEKVIESSAERTFAQDEIVKIVLEAWALQEADRRMHDRATLDSITEHLPIRDVDLLGVNAAYAAARELDIEKKYVDKTLRKHYPTVEEQLNDLAEVNASPPYMIRRGRRKRDVKRIADAYERELVLALTENYPLDNFSVKRKDWNREIMDPDWYGSRLKIYMGMGTFKKKMIAELLFGGNEDFRPKLFIELYDPVFTNACRNIIKELETRFKDRISKTDVKFNYDPLEEKQNLN